MFDETTDISRVSQMTLILRFFDNIAVHESFIKFIDVRHDANNKIATEKNSTKIVP